ncbi:MAG TPA: histidinol dehydrogenase, partial [Cytophagales bacterium]|nr:histidinol dehydrogenase [Cytophagales bacterium]
MQVIRYPEPAAYKAILSRPVMDTTEIESRVQPILSAVKQHGDKALIDFTQQFDKIRLDQLLVSDAEFVEAEGLVSDELKNAINVAYSNIFKFHEAQQQTPNLIETMEGVTCWRKSVAIDKVGLYIPGGTAPLFSTVLMLGIPANIAGCREIIMCTPSGANGKINPTILYASKLVGVHKVFKVGGAQAIAAMAYGTESVPLVYKIFGPGNQYVTAAKQLVTKHGCAIDMPAGPSEVMVYADAQADAAFVASDLLSQAEHGNDSQVVLLTNNEALVEKVRTALQQQIEQLERQEFIKNTLNNSKIILVADDAQALDIINEYAPEHLILAIENAEEVAEKVINAGSVFIGNLTPESAGDYASGTNHTLPTNGYAKAYSGVSLDSYVKKITFQKITKSGLEQIGPVVEIMAEAECL